jgi:hypothetical protein
MTRALGIWFGLAMPLLIATTASADPTAVDRATARALALEGYAALQQKDYKKAGDRFSRADELVHAPTLVVDWARSLVGLGKFVEAVERYELVIREGVAPNALKSWQQAFSDAGRELTALKPRLAWITLTVVGRSAAVSIDGDAVPPAAVGVRRPINPGTRIIRATAHGFLPIKKTLELAEGSDSDVRLVLEPDPDAEPAEPVAVPKPPPPPPPEPTGSGSGRRTLAYVALGVGGAGLLAGGITGGVALSYRSDLNKTPAAQRKQSTIDSYHLFGTISTVGFAVGAAGAVTGLVLWLTAPKAESAKGANNGFGVQPYLGLGTVGAVGVF